MIVVVNDYSVKYWLDNDIKDCSNNSSNDTIELEILCEYEKLKDNYNTINSDKNNGEIINRNKDINSKNGTIKFTKNPNRQEFNRYENKNNKFLDSKKTNKYINIQRSHNTNNNKKTMYDVSSSSRISEPSSKITLLETYTKYRVKNLV